jgi:hypothetical protein
VNPYADADGGPKEGLDDKYWDWMAGQTEYKMKSMSAEEKKEFEKQWMHLKKE